MTKRLGGNKNETEEMKKIQFIIKIAIHTRTCTRNIQKTHAYLWQTAATNQHLNKLKTTYKQKRASNIITITQDIN